MNDTNKELSSEQKIANKALSFAIGGIAVQIIGIYIHLGGLLSLVITLAPIFCEIMAVRYARKALTSNDPSVIEKAKWARGIAYVILGLVGFGILAIPFLIFIDVNFALSLIVGIGTILILGAIFIFLNRKKWSKKKTVCWASAVVASAVLVALYFALLNGFDSDKKHVQLFSAEHWKILGERVGIESSGTPQSGLDEFTQKYELAAQINEQLNKEVTDPDLFKGDIPTVKQKISGVLELTQNLQKANSDFLTSMSSEEFVNRAKNFSEAEKDNLQLVSKILEIQDRRNKKLIEYLTLFLNTDVMTPQRHQELTDLGQEFTDLQNELSAATK